MRSLLLSSLKTPLFSNSEHVGHCWLVWSLVLNFHTILRGSFIHRKQVTTISCLLRGRETQNDEGSLLLIAWQVKWRWTWVLQRQPWRSQSGLAGADVRLGGSRQQCSLTAKSSSGPETPALRCGDLAGREQTQGPSWAGPGRTEDQATSRQAVWSGILRGFQAPAMETADRRWKAKQNFSASVLHVQGPNLLPAFQFSFFVRECFVLSRAQFKQCGYFRFFFFRF